MAILNTTAKAKDRKGVEHMKKSNRNIRVLAKNIDKSTGFNIYLDFSGQMEFLMVHRHNGLLFSLLKDGICVDDLTRWSPKNNASSHVCMPKPWSRQAKKLAGMVAHLMDVIGEYLEDRECGLEMVPNKPFSGQQRERVA